MMADLEKYLVYFNSESDNIKSYINDLDNSISSVKNQLKEAENALKIKLNEISNKNKKINEKLHDVSGDYDELYLISAAEELKELRIIKEDIEAESKEMTDALKNNLSDLELDKNKNVELKNKINTIKTNAEKELKECYKNCDMAVNAIRKAIEVCSNPNLTIALDEEEEAKERRLDEIATKYKNDAELLLNKEISTTKEEVKSENNNEDIFENRTSVEINYADDDSKVEIEIDEPSSKDELPNVKEEVFDEDRKVLDVKTISNEQIMAIENSSIVENGLKNFFI